MLPSARALVNLKQRGMCFVSFFASVRRVFVRGVGCFDVRGLAGAEVFASFEAWWTSVQLGLRRGLSRFHA